MKFTLSGEPKSTQHIYQSACRGRFPTVYMTAQGKGIKQAYQWEARSQYRGKPLAGELAVSVRFYFATRRKRDLDNQNKLVLDALSGIAYADDSQIVELTLRRDHDPAKPRIEVTVERLQ